MHLKKLGKPLMKRLKIARALLKSIKEFMSKTPVHAYHYLVEPNRHIAERLMWIVLHSTMTVSAIYIVINLFVQTNCTGVKFINYSQVLFAWARFTDNPTITTLESQHYSVFGLDFPAVGICSNNKISRARAEEYADFL